VPEVETKPDWNLGQMLRKASFQAGTVIAFVSGNLCYRIEYDRFPDLPSNRYPEIAERLRAFCRTYDRPGDSVREQISEDRGTIAFIRQRGRRAATRIADGNARPK
jgi:fatty acid desaturase